MYRCLVIFDIPEHHNFQPKRLCAHFHPTRNIHATRVVTLSAEERGIMSKNNSRGSTLQIRPIWVMNCHTPESLLKDNLIRVNNSS